MHCTVVELFKEGVTKMFHQMEVNETFMLFYIWQMKENTLWRFSCVPWFLNMVPKFSINNQLLERIWSADTWDMMYSFSIAKCKKV